MDTIASRIKAQRRAKKYSQVFMAKQLNITQPSYSRIESGLVTPDIKKLRLLAQILEVDIHVFLDGD